MDEADEDERDELRVQVKVPKLPYADAECVISGFNVTLRDASGQEVKLSLMDFERRSGWSLRFRSRAAQLKGNCIDFAGMGGDAKFQVLCLDEATAEKVADRIKNPFADTS